MSIKRPSALVVLSGGQDSTTCLFWALSYFDTVHTVTFNYGQRHAAELVAAQTVVRLAAMSSGRTINHEVINIPNVLGGVSPLTNPNEQLETYTDYASMDKIIGDRVEKTFVPMRNALFLTVAANRAVCLGVDHLVTGVCGADNANYPDCRHEFIMAQEAAINEALGYKGQKFQIAVPLMYLSKAASIGLALSLGEAAYLALAFTHTAYDGKFPPTGQDHASVLRAQGFVESGYPDPLVIRAARAGLMTLPDTSNYGSKLLCAEVADKIVALGAKL